MGRLCDSKLQAAVAECGEVYAGRQAGNVKKSFCESVVVHFDVAWGPKGAATARARNTPQHNRTCGALPKRLCLCMLPLLSHLALVFSPPAGQMFARAGFTVRIFDINAQQVCVYCAGCSVIACRCLPLCCCIEVTAFREAAGRAHVCAESVHTYILCGG